MVNCSTHRFVAILPAALSLALAGAPCFAQGSEVIQAEDLGVQLKKHIETGIVPAVRVRGESQRFTLKERMRELRVPAISIAVFENFKVVWSMAYGVADADTGSAATTKTLFQAASISKPVNAMAVLRIAEQKKLSLDAPINSLLKSWKLPGHRMD